MLAAGRASMTMTASTRTEISTGRRMTFVARACQKPPLSLTEVSLRRISRHLLMRGPIHFSSAGAITRVTAAASSAVVMQPTASDRSMVYGSASTPRKQTATVSAENITVRPAVRSVTLIASSMFPSRARSSSR